MKHFKGDEEVAFVAVQTVFEGFSSNTLKRAGETAARYDLDIPIGHSGSAGQFSSLMRNYRTGGTPWTIIIDKQGVVRFNSFRIEAEDAIHGLISENPIQTSVLHDTGSGLTPCCSAQSINARGVASTFRYPPRSCRSMSVVARCKTCSSGGSRY